MMNEKLSEVIGALAATGLRDQFTPEISRFVVYLLRQIGQGQPILMEQAQRLASSQGVAGDVFAKVIQQFCERDKDGNIVGLTGLSQNNHAHKFRVNGQLLSTWCALDALFLPILLNQTAEVIDECPVTREPIRLVVSPRAVEQYQPASTTVSIVTPATRLETLSSAAEIWAAFCNYTHFFSSPAAAESWFSKKDQPVHFVSVEDAFQVGKAGMGSLVEHV